MGRGGREVEVEEAEETRETCGGGWGRGVEVETEVVVKEGGVMEEVGGRWWRWQRRGGGDCGGGTEGVDAAGVGRWRGRVKEGGGRRRWGTWMRWGWREVGETEAARKAGGGAAGGVGKVGEGVDGGEEMKGEGATEVGDGGRRRREGGDGGGDGDGGGGDGGGEMETEGEGDGGKEEVVAKVVAKGEGGDGGGEKEEAEMEGVMDGVEEMEGVMETEGEDKVEAEIDSLLYA
ncbi:hypothetical protein CYMTET_34166 [Cymbomonas tetramitiformis]|uniref:Uncharacterized protein n=1 Tax=Cymbomonas tetramitiformis TaxID=36881 RepID=A0AAE0KQ47_9CHLO|nr:hypothetical protein CYMTET_34166 [Cymbomonas tetramitiformis]